MGGGGAQKKPALLTKHKCFLRTLRSGSVGVLANGGFSGSRDRGPVKSWRPQTMAEAIMAVVHDGLSLSQVSPAGTGLIPQKIPTLTKTFPKMCFMKVEDKNEFY